MIIFPSINDPYVYLKQLDEDNSLTYRRITYAVAMSYLNVGHLQNINSQKVQLSLDFLKQQAAQERANEIAFLSDKLRQLGKYDGERIQNLTRILGQNPDDINYVKFIRELNEVMIGIERTNRRVKSLLNTKAGRKSLNVEALGAADTLLKDLKAARGKVESNMNEVIRGLVFKFFEEQCQEQISKLFQEKGLNVATRDFTAMAIYLQQSVYTFLLDNPQILDYKSYTEVKDLDAEIERIYKTFLPEFMETTTAKNLTSGGTLLETVLKEVNDFFEISVENKAVKKVKIKKGLNEDRVQKLFSSTGIDAKKLRIMLRRTTIKSKFTSQQFGNFKELGSIITDNLSGNAGVNIGIKGGGTDTVLAGYMSLKMNDLDTEQLLQEEQIILDDLKRALKSSNDETENDPIYRETLEKLNELYKSVKEIEKGFVIHESTKYYKTLEQTGRFWNGQKGFSGRDMLLSNYVEKISHLGGKLGIDTKWLQFAALNLADNAAGSHLVYPLEYYLTTFIGFIMFDDFESATKNFAATLPDSKINSIHLYRLQDLYFPTSYFLEQTYQRMTQISDDLYNNNGFSLRITTKSVPQELVGNSTAEDWENVKEHVRQNTKIETLFSANFMQLVSQIFPS